MRDSTYFSHDGGFTSATRGPQSSKACLNQPSVLASVAVETEDLAANDSRDFMNSSRA